MSVFIVGPGGPVIIVVGIGWPQQALAAREQPVQEAKALAVGPLQIVHHEHEGKARADALEQLEEALERRQLARRWIGWFRNRRRSSLAPR